MMIGISIISIVTFLCWLEGRQLHKHSINFYGANHGQIIIYAYGSNNQSNSIGEFDFSLSHCLFFLAGDDFWQKWQNKRRWPVNFEGREAERAQKKVKIQFSVITPAIFLYNDLSIITTVGAKDEFGQRILIQLTEMVLHYLRCCCAACTVAEWNC